MSEQVAFRDGGTIRFEIISNFKPICTIFRERFKEKTEYYELPDGRFLKREGRLNDETIFDFLMGSLISPHDMRDEIVNAVYSRTEETLDISHIPKLAPQQHPNPPPDEEVHSIGTPKTTISQQTFHDILASDKPGQALFDILFRETPTPSDSNTSEFRPYRIVEKTTLECTLPDGTSPSIRLEPAAAKVLRMLIDAGERGISFAKLKPRPKNYSTYIGRVKRQLQAKKIPDHIHTTGNGGKGAVKEDVVYAIRRALAPALPESREVAISSSLSSASSSIAHGCPQTNS